LHLSHLVREFIADGEGYITLEGCWRDVKEAHDYLARRGTNALEGARGAENPLRWGSRIKRVRVSFPEGERPRLIDPKLNEHNLVEVVNQCATMERLLDALEWAGSKDSGLAAFAVERCHPTTSSSAGDDEDHDLVLIGPGGQKAKFEVADVVSERDGNDKQKSSLVSLGVLREGKGDQIYPASWPEGSLFLVVSEELARRLQKSKRRWLRGDPPHCHYDEVLGEGPTRIFEVKRGQRH
jgi:hypothetical protein